MSQGCSMGGRSTRSRKKVKIRLRQDGRYPATMAAIINAPVASETLELDLKELQRKVWQLEIKTQRLDKCVAEAKEMMAG